MRVEQALRQANRQLNLMTSVTRHDIINRVMVIQAYLDLLSEEVSTEAAAGIIARLNAATGAIKDQIEFTQVYRDLGYHPPRWHPLVDLLPVHELPEKVRFTASVDGIEVYADQLLPKVFFNLLDNALRHGEGVTEIRFCADRHGEDLILSWEDDGVGVSATEKERIFERGVGKDRGLGLFLVREILAITGITIIEAGTLGVGARFRITVPKGSFRSTVQIELGSEGRGATLRASTPHPKESGDDLNPSPSEGDDTDDDQKGEDRQVGEGIPLQDET